MISLDNPPPDPSSSSCSSFDQISSHLKKSSSDEKSSASASASASVHNQLALVEEEEVDLLKSGLDDSNPLPKFCIRDYVFRSRSKDITTNWPFSQKKLQLCLKHGVTNLLPPFQPLDLLRNPPSVRRSCTFENNKEILSSCDHGGPSRPNHQFASAISSDNAKFKPKLAVDSLSINSIGLKGADTEEKSSQKTESTIQTPVKKCRLVVKFSPVVEPAVNTNSDIIPNSFMVSETMASKVCPVCKIFSSSSNTTLNAHIDQCLSRESTMKWTANSKVVKHRIKPRKTRLMVDIYETAPYCTLEELDRRNGTSWANSTFPAQEIEFDGTKVNLDNGHEGAVYIDTDGTKVRILSVPKLGIGDDDDGSRKLVKGGKGSKLLMSKKRKRLDEQKHRTYLKLAPHSKKFCSPKPRGFETRSGEKEISAFDRRCNIEDRQQQRFNAQGHIKLDDSGTIRPWICSRRTGHAKKSIGKDDNLHSRYNATKDLLVESDKSCLGGSHVDRRCVSTPSSSDNPISLPKSSKRMETSAYEPREDEYRELPLQKKRVGFRSGSPVGGGYGKRRSLVLPNQTLKKLRKESTSLHDSCGDPPNYTEKHAFSPSKKSDDFVTSSKGSKFSSLRKNLLSVSRESAIKKSRLQHPILQDPIKQKSGMEIDIAEKTSIGRLNVLKIRKKKGAVKIYENIDSSVQTGTALVKSLGDVETHGKHINIKPASRIDVEASYMSLSKSLNPEFHKLVSPLCSPETSLDGKDEMFCADDIDETMIGQNIRVTAESDSKDTGQGNYFAEVDPIPIPGPPGSFLPSPGRDIVADDHLQGNSLLTTSRVQSSEDLHDMVGRDSSSDSPISSISNPTLARSDSRSSEKMSVKSLAPKIDALEENSVLVPPAANIGAERTNVDEWRVDMIFHEKAPLGLKNDQPCRCSRKEGASQSVASNYQDLNFRPEIFSLSNYPSSATEMVMKSPAGNIPLSASTDSEVKFPIHDESDSASPSSSKPVLRLMGHNLMVVKKVEDATSPLLRPQSRSSAMNEDYHPIRQFCTVSGVSPGNVQNEDYHSFHEVFPEGPIFCGQNRSHFDLKAPQIPIHATEAMFASTTVVGGGFMPSMECYGRRGPHLGHTPQARPRQDHNTDQHEYKGGSNLPTEQTRPKYSLETQLAHDGNVYSTSNHIKEIIIIDDSPENEADSSTETEQTRRNWARSSSSIPIHVPSSGYNNSRYMNPFYNYQSHSSPYAGSPVVHNASFQSPPFREVKASLTKWNSTPEGSSILHPSSLAASSPSTGHLRSTLYYPRRIL